MTTVRIPRLLAETVNTGLSHSVEGSTVAEALDALFAEVPGLRTHLLDETGSVRPHVSLFVDGLQSDMTTIVGRRGEIRILHAVSGG